MTHGSTEAASSQSGNLSPELADVSAQLGQICPAVANTPGETGLIDTTGFITDSTFRTKEGFRFDTIHAVIEDGTDLFGVISTSNATSAELSTAGTSPSAEPARTYFLTRFDAQAGRPSIVGVISQGELLASDGTKDTHKQRSSAADFQITIADNQQGENPIVFMNHNQAKPLVVYANQANSDMSVAENPNNPLRKSLSWVPHAADIKQALSQQPESEKPGEAKLGAAIISAAIFGGEADTSNEHERDPSKQLDALAVSATSIVAELYKRGDERVELAKNYLGEDELRMKQGSWLHIPTKHGRDELGTSAERAIQITGARALLDPSGTIAGFDKVHIEVTATSRFGDGKGGVVIYGGDTRNKLEAEISLDQDGKAELVRGWSATDGWGGPVHFGDEQNPSSAQHLVRNLQTYMTQSQQHLKIDPPVR